MVKSLKHIGQTKVIDGKEYKRSDSWSTKTEAKSVAQFRRKENYGLSHSIRVMKVGSKYAIFERQKNASFRKR